MRSRIKTLLNLAQFEAGRVRLGIEDVSIGEIVAEAVRDALAVGRSRDRCICCRVAA